MDGTGWQEVRYDDILRDGGEHEDRPLPSLPPVPTPHGAEFEQTQRLLEELSVKPAKVGVFELTDQLVGALIAKRVPFVGGDTLLQGLAVRAMDDVHRYATDSALRRAILHRLLDQLPTGDVVLFAHSLGSVAALGMLPYISVATRVRLLVTLGSPAALEVLRKEALLAGTPQADFPSDRVGGWLNLTNSWDPVSLGAGLRGSFSAVIDHRIADRGIRGSAVHDPRTYLSDPILPRALGAVLDADRDLVVSSQQRPDNTGLTATELAVLLTVLYARLIGEGAEKAADQRNCRKIVDEVLLPAVGDAFDRRLDVAEVGFEVSRWVAAGQSELERSAVLLMAALSDPFAPFDPGTSKEDRRNGLRDLATWLGLTADRADEVLDLVDEAAKVATNQRRGSWRLLLVGVGVVASMAVAAPFAIGAFAATGATGAAAMTSGLAGIGVGGMAGGIGAVAGVAAGVGVLGAAISGPSRTALLGDEAAVIQELTRRAAVIRLLQEDSDPNAKLQARSGIAELAQLADEVRALQERHEAFSDPKSGAASAVAKNAARIEAVQSWLAEDHLALEP